MLKGDLVLDKDVVYNIRMFPKNMKARLIGNGSCRSQDLNLENYNNSNWTFYAVPQDKFFAWQIYYGKTILRNELLDCGPKDSVKIDYKVYFEDAE